MGYHLAGFEVVGVDLADQPRYPFAFHRADALEYPLGGFDAIHASPPCQAFSTLGALSAREHPDLVAAVRARLVAAGVPWIMENVVGSPLERHVVLCGSAFGLGANGRQLRRHRVFEASFPIMGPPCCHVGQPVGVYGTGGGGTMNRGYKGTPAEYREAMGMEWATRAEIAQAVPPAYTELLGAQLIAHLARAAA